MADKSIYIKCPNGDAATAEVTLADGTRLTECITRIDLSLSVDTGARATIHLVGLKGEFKVDSPDYVVEAGSKSIPLPAGLTPGQAETIAQALGKAFGYSVGTVGRWRP